MMVMLIHMTHTILRSEELLLLPHQSSCLEKRGRGADTMTLHLPESGGLHHPDHPALGEEEMCLIPLFLLDQQFLDLTREGEVGTKEDDSGEVRIGLIHG